jgi:hypothetical protein
MGLIQYTVFSTLSTFLLQYNYYYTILHWKGTRNIPKEFNLEVCYRMLMTIVYLSCEHIRQGGFIFLRASPAVLSMWSSTVKLDEEKSKHAGLAQENGCG